MAHVEKVEKPLVSFVVFTYNQERYIREAVLSALAQTYSPLEIIISDDCSQDNTAKIIQEEVKKYKGPHKVIININEKNLGIGGHINQVMILTKGTLVVGAAGDDISLPERTEKLVLAWTASKFKNISIYSNTRVINAEGNEIGVFSDKSPTAEQLSVISQSSGKYFVTGCSLAWSKSLFELFGPLDNAIIREDTIIPFRAALIGTVKYINEPLVLYRRHGENIWKSRKEIIKPKVLHNYLQFHSRGEVSICKNMLHDLDVARQISPHTEIEKARNNVSTRLQVAKYERDLLEECKPMERIRLIYKAYCEHLPLKKLIKWVLMFFFPRIYIYIFLTIQR